MDSEIVNSASVDARIGHRGTRIDLDGVGKRYRVHVLLRICPLRLAGAGLQLFRSPNGVMLARRVPVEALLD